MSTSSLVNTPRKVKKNRWMYNPEMFHLQTTEKGCVQVAECIKKYATNRTSYLIISSI